MPPSATKANYKSYEAQARMVRAIVAAHPKMSWNYKEICACYGSDMTDYALNHRFRRIRTQAVIIKEARSQGLDLKELSVDENVLPDKQGAVDKKNIAKYFGQSTTHGIQFQFRNIKKDAETLRDTVSKGGDASSCLSLGAGAGTRTTPSKPTTVRGQASRSGARSKRKIDMVIKEPPTDEEDEEDTDYSAMAADTPSKRQKITGPAVGRQKTPSCQAATKAFATIAATSAMLQDHESPTEDVLTPTSYTSIFGGGIPSVKSEPQSGVHPGNLDLYQSRAGFVKWAETSADTFLNYDGNEAGYEGDI